MAGEPVSYLDGWTVGLLVLGFLVAGVCTVAGLRGRPPGRATLGATVLLQVGVTVVVGSYLVRTLGGQGPVGPAWELWAYLVTVLLLPALGWLWAREEPSRWSSFVLAVAAFVAVVMVARAAQIWYGVGSVAG
jgi:hypothetical protein